MPSIKVYLHFVWTTKMKIPFLYHVEIRKKVWHHITVYAKSKDIRVMAVNGHTDHCHCLVSLTNTQRICEVIQYLKGESSYWINQTGLIKDYFISEIHQTLVKQALAALKLESSYDVTVNVEGGGVTGQAEAVRLGIARALVEISPENKPTLRKEGFMTRDSRMVERKKPGRRKARRKFQFSKR